jgi:hypothetical protein
MGPTTTEALHLAASNWLGFHRSPQSDFNPLASHCQTRCPTIGEM